MREIAAQLLQQAGQMLVRPEGQIFGNLPPDEPEGGDKEAYIDAVIARAKELIGDADFRDIAQLALKTIIADMDRRPAPNSAWSTTAGTRKLRWPTNGAIDRALERLRKQGHVYEKDGALWFRATAFGDEKDRVVVRENGVKTYFASDIAYHLEKRERGFDLLLDILGSDHHGYTARVRAGLEAMGEPPESLEVQLVQFVSLYRGGEKVPMSTRAGEFVTLRQLRGEVGNDAARFFYVLQAATTSRCDFDLELAKSRSNDNPVYYIQYAHARVASVGRQLAAKGYPYDAGVGAGEPRDADLAARDRGADHAGQVSGNDPARRCATARRTRWCTSCASSRRLSTPGTTPSSSSSRMRRCAMRASRWRWPRSRW